MTGLFGFRFLFPLDGARGLGREVVKDAVHAGNLGGDAVGDLAAAAAKGTSSTVAVMASTVLTARRMTGHS